MTNERWQATRTCLFALITRLLLPIAYLVFVGLYPIRLFDLGVGTAVAWLFAFVLVAPTALVVAFVSIGRRGRQRGRR
jgi:membrane protein implicated in regulation of membrane protease activity